MPYPPNRFNTRKREDRKEREKWKRQQRAKEMGGEGKEGTTTTV